MKLHLPLRHGDAHGFRNPIMVASNAGSIYGSYPFVSSYPEHPAATGLWHELPFRGNEEIRLTHLEDDARLYGRSHSARLQTMPYAIQDHHYCIPLL